MPPKKKYHIGLPYWSNLSALRKWLIGAAATVVAITTLLSAFDLQIQWPFYLRSDGAALAASVQSLLTTQQQLLSTQNYLLGRAYTSDRQSWCAQAQIALVRLRTNPNDQVAQTMLETARQMVAQYNTQLHYQPPPASGPPC